jgi:hypothetical protein
MIGSPGTKRGVDLDQNRPDYPGIRINGVRIIGSGSPGSGTPESELAGCGLSGLDNRGQNYRVPYHRGSNAFVRKMKYGSC